ncbi:MAG: ABC-F family ATP-binding cassette domain-containing protein [Pseudomonadota bacterium]
MAAPLLSLRDIRLQYDRPLFDGADLNVHERDRIGLVGRNGSGKSTFLKIAAGLIEPDAGERTLTPGTTVRYLEQEPDFSGSETALAAVKAGLGPADDPHNARRLLEALGLTGDEHRAALSGGEGRRVAIAKALAPDPDILLLDEPTNHLDLAVIDWLEGELKRSRAALVLISHDRRFLSELTTRTIWIDRGLTRRLEKGFAHFEAWRDKTFEEEETAAHKLDRKIAAEEDWVRYGVTARRKRNVRRMRELGELRAQRREARRRVGGPAIAAAEGDKSGKRVVEARGVAKAFGERTIVSSFSIEIVRGDRIGLVGPNGAGKTTLLRLLTGDLEPDAGEVTLGVNLETVSLDQRRADLKPTDTVQDVLTGGRGDAISVGGVQRHVIGYLKDFLFTPDQARAPVSSLSGGERGRLALAAALARPSNLLVLDEPTNDLDLETLDVLEDALADYHGTVLLVSHDRDFLDRIVTSVVAPEGGGRWIEYVGGYSDMVRERAEAAGRASRKDKPTANATPAERPAARAAKLSFKEQRALELLPDEIAKLDEDIAKLTGVLADPELYARDAARFEKATRLLAEREALKAEKEEAWLELELKREAVEG